MAEVSEVELCTLLVKANVDMRIIVFMQDDAPMGLEIRSLPDFVNYVTHSLYQTELQSEILDVLPDVDGLEHPLKNSRISLARLRTAWQEAAAHIEQKRRPRIDRAQDNLDVPIEDGISTDLPTDCQAEQHDPFTVLMPTAKHKQRGPSRPKSPTNAPRTNQNSSGSGSARWHSSLRHFPALTVAGEKGERRGTKTASGTLIKTVAMLMPRDRKNRGGQEICKRFNDPRGCTHHERDCPQGRLHVCDVRRPEGGACGSTKHRRLDDCPFVALQ
jgi:hypothetical protein